MSNIMLRDYQLEALKKMKNGCILCGGVGSGKSITAIAYYYLQNGGEIGTLMGLDYEPMDDLEMRDLYIITTARKRDTFEWEGELTPFLLSTNPEVSLYPAHKVVIDSWNNIKKYANVTGAFFIFDEQRVVGSGVWVKSFLRISNRNRWILLSATPGDTWKDYIPVFVANGFYRNKTEFSNEHIVWSRFSKYPKIDRYLGEGRLIRYRNNILIPMKFERTTTSHHENIFVNYDSVLYKTIIRTRRNPFTEKPIKNASEFCYLLRKVVNSDVSRQISVLEIMEKHDRAIIFYNFDYELDALKSLAWVNSKTAEWNGHKHEPIPTGERWVYFVQYNAGNEGWNCIKTDTIIFYSQNYSYKVMVQAAGRIDRMNTPYKDLYYYHLRSRSSIDISIQHALDQKKKFNQSGFFNGNSTR